MNLLLDSTAIGWALFTLTAGIIGLIFLVRFQLAKRSQQEQFEKSNNTITSRNKYTEVNVFKWSSTFLRVGMMSSLAFVVLAFNYTTYETVNFELGLIDNGDVIENDVPRTMEPPKPPPPPPPPPAIEEVDLDEIEEEPEFIDNEIEEKEEIIARSKPTPVIKTPIKPTLPPPDEPENTSPVIFAEQMPRFPGCVAGDKKTKDACSTKALFTFLSTKLKYPALARENGISGTAVIRFIVEKDGSLTDLEIVKDPGSGLGKEALRVVQLMNKMEEKWTPGKQNARPVRVRFNLPVKFRLQ